MFGFSTVRHKTGCKVLNLIITYVAYSCSGAVNQSTIPPLFAVTDELQCKASIPHQGNSAREILGS